MALRLYARVEVEDKDTARISSGRSTMACFGFDYVIMVFVVGVRPRFEGWF